MKKITCILLSALLLLTLGGCAVENSNQSNGNSAAVIGTNNFSTAKGKTLISDYITDLSVQGTKYIEGYNGFVWQNQSYSGYATYNKRLLDSSTLNLKLGDTGDYMAHGATVLEWSSNYLLKSFTTTVPTSKVNAVERYFAEMNEYATSDKQATGLHPWMHMDSYLNYQHYAVEAGCDIVGTEIGVGNPGYAKHIAFTRGAAKQYGIPWWIDFSMWNGYTMANYSGNSNLFQSPESYGGTTVLSEPNGGQGLSQCRRAYFLAYMSGSAWFNVEAGAIISYYTELDSNGNYKLTPVGKVVQEVYEFTKRNPDRGVNYTPFAVVIDYYHGSAFAQGRALKAFETFNYNSGDSMTYNLINMLTPGAFEVNNDNRYSMTNSPYGDTYDILLQNASLDVLKSYPVVVLSGDIKFDETTVAGEVKTSASQIDTYAKYVENGGTLVLNTAYAKYFTNYFNATAGNTVTYGNGKVICYGPDYDITELDGILSGLRDQLVPVKVTGDVEYLVNIKDGGIIVTVFNNRGVTKPDNVAEPEVIDPTKTQDVTIEYTGGYDVLEVRDLIGGVCLEKNAKQTVTIGPGDVAIIEFVA